MTKEDLAQLLNGCEYRNEGSDALYAQAKAAGLFVIFGASDDLMEFRGAINDETGAYEGATVLLSKEGLLPGYETLIYNKKPQDVLEHFFEMKKRSLPIHAIWNRYGYSWVYETKIPHATFDVMEDGETYCRGIVISLGDLP